MAYGKTKGEVVTIKNYARILSGMKGDAKAQFKSTRELKTLSEAEREYEIARLNLFRLKKGAYGAKTKREKYERQTAEEIMAEEYLKKGLLPKEIALKVEEALERLKRLKYSEAVGTAKKAADLHTRDLDYYGAVNAVLEDKFDITKVKSDTALENIYQAHLNGEITLKEEDLEAVERKLGIAGVGDVEDRKEDVIEELRAWAKGVNWMLTSEDKGPVEDIAEADKLKARAIIDKYHSGNLTERQREKLQEEYEEMTGHRIVSRRKKQKNLEL